MSCIFYNARLTIIDSAIVYTLGNIGVNTKLNKDFQKLTPRYFSGSKIWNLMCVILYIGYKLPLISKVQEILNHKISNAKFPI